MKLLPGAMEIALEEAAAAASRGEVPVGAVVTDSVGRILARAGNRTLELKDPSAHAEMLAIREACRRTGRCGGHFLPRFFAQPTCHHAPEIYDGLGARRAAELLKAFFAQRR